MVDGFVVLKSLGRYEPRCTFVKTMFVSRVLLTLHLSTAKKWPYIGFATNPDSAPGCRPASRLNIEWIARNVFRKVVCSPGSRLRSKSNFREETKEKKKRSRTE